MIGIRIAIVQESIDLRMPQLSWVPNVTWNLWFELV
jgi:hypothetical protein